MKELRPNESKESKNERPHDIGDRSYAFALRIVRVVDAIPKTLGGNAIGRQLIRSGTAVGANVHEARGSSTRKEYSRRIKIARSEAHESICWIRLLGDSGYIARKRLEPILKDADELVRILATIGKKTETKTK